MKSFILLLLFLNWGCGEKSKTVNSEAQGVGQGNGMSHYNMSSGLRFSYYHKLKLTEYETDHIQIDNSKLLNIDDQLSSINIQAIPNSGEKKLRSENDLKMYVKKSYPSMKWEKDHLPGASIFVSENRSETQLTSKYFILTTQEDFIEITIEAYKDAEGIKWISPIVYTLTYDNSPPAIKEIKFNDSLKPGINTVLVRVYDDYSGLKKISLGLNKLEGKSYYTHLQSKEVTSLNDDWYRIDFELENFVASGLYEVLHISLEDHAGNMVMQHIDLFKIGKYEVQIENDGETDIVSPKVTDAKYDEKLIAGEQYSLKLKIIEKETGVDLKIKGWSFDANDRNGKQGISDRIANYNWDIIPLKDNWYELKFTVNKYLASGTYNLPTPFIRDNAGNPADIKLDNKVQVTESKFVDITPPILKQVIYPSTWHAKAKNTVKFKVTDNSSGTWKDISFNMFSLRSQSEIKGLNLKVFESKALGNDWYQVDIFIDEFIPSGSYKNLTLRVWDMAGNWTRWTSEPRKRITVIK